VCADAASAEVVHGSAPNPQASGTPDVAPDVTGTSGPLHDFEPALPRSAPRLAPSTVPSTGLLAPSNHAGETSDRLVGRLVHRLIERLGLRSTEGEADLAMVAERLIRPDERPDVTDVEGLLSSVVETYRLLGTHEDLDGLLEGAEALHEVPFTLSTDQGFVRGTLDCLLCEPDGRLVVLELKTGRPRPEHQAQAELYERAVRALAPDAPVEVRLVYATRAGAQNSFEEGQIPR